MFGCSGVLAAAFREGKDCLSWDGMFQCSRGTRPPIAQAKLMVDLGVDASSLFLPGDRPSGSASEKSSEPSSRNKPRTSEGTPAFSEWS